MTVLYWNHRDLSFRDVKVCRALTLAINRRELLQVLNFPPGTPVLDALFSRRQIRSRDFPEPMPYHPELANRLLEEAGWRTQNQEGLRERDGKPFNFTVLAGNQYGQEDAVVYIQTQFRRVGVRMNIDRREPSAIFERTLAGDYEAAINVLYTAGGAWRRSGTIFDRSQLCESAFPRANKAAPKRL
jgi:peptide/nickel transport system substrate-binding protein